MLTEQQYIARESAKHDRRICRLLRSVDQTGECGFKDGELLISNGLAQVGGPRPGVSEYNCLRLTEEGRAKLAELSSKSARKATGERR